MQVKSSIADNVRLISINYVMLFYGALLFSNTIHTSSAEEIFTEIYTHNRWFSNETASGHGSELKVTNPIREKISQLIEEYRITSLLDAPCGDLNWMKHVNLGSCSYIGIDIVKAIIDKNIEQYGSNRQFIHQNLIDNEIPFANLILCRDLLAHLTFTDIFKVLKNFKNSGAKYLLVTTNIRTSINYDIDQSGGWRLLNLEKAPFNFPQPLTLIEEDVPYECEKGKHLALWLLEDLVID